MDVEERDGPIMKNIFAICLLFLLSFLIINEARAQNTEPIPTTFTILDNNDMLINKLYKRIAELGAERDNLRGVRDQACEELADILSGKIPKVINPVFDYLNVAAATIGERKQMTKLDSVIIAINDMWDRCT